MKTLNIEQMKQVAGGAYTRESAQKEMQSTIFAIDTVYATAMFMTPAIYAINPMAGLITSACLQVTSPGLAFINFASAYDVVTDGSLSQTVVDMQ